MIRKKWLLAALVAAPLAIGGALAYLHASAAQGYVCPITGQKLPCPKCCPLNRSH